MVRIEDEWLLAVGSVALVGSLLLADLPLVYVALVAAAIVAVDVVFLRLQQE
jgi:hypothetical protein